MLTFELISGGADIAWLGKGLPSLLTTGLAQTPDIEVVGPERLNDAARTTEPRHVIALARLLDKAGQRDAARVLASSLGRVSGGRRP